MLQIDVVLVGEIGAVRTARAVAVRVTTLNYEVVQDAMEGKPIVETVFDK